MILRSQDVSRVWIKTRLDEDSNAKFFSRCFIQESQRGLNLLLSH